MPGHTPSVEFPGYIDCGNGMLRMPYVWRGKSANHYFHPKECTNCKARHLQSRANAGRYVVSFCSRSCRSAHVKKTFEGTKVRKDREHGYHVLVKQWDHPRAGNAGQVYEHILVAEQSLGRPIEKTERVHHINCVKSDNRPENLFVCSTHIEHFKIHGSLNACVSELMEMGVLQFDRETRTYIVSGARAARSV